MTPSGRLLGIDCFDSIQLTAEKTPVVAQQRISRTYFRTGLHTQSHEGYAHQDIMNQQLPRPN
jgi:hypothetical protein